MRRDATTRYSSAGLIIHSMAVPAKLDANKSFEEEPEYALPPTSKVKPEWAPHVHHAAKLYGLGYDRKQIAKVLSKLLWQGQAYRPEDAYQMARRRLRGWEQKQWFRDLVWDYAVVELDMKTPQILRGVTAKAKKGRVDAAKLALAITGRHHEKDQAVPAAVTINIANIPRPTRQAVEAGDDQIGMVVDED